ncbi:MAG TPA: SRPBCC family protein [Candidatus Nitrosotalea sp.]|nr:SRPBCC family protein [Candidatus Nitrosotalea sp.]
MVEIKVKVQIEAPVEKVWDVISRVDDDPKFWTLMKAIRNISKNDNEISREVTLGKTEKCSQTISLIPREAIHVHWTKGVIQGVKDFALMPLGNGTLLEISMNYKISGPARFFPGRVTDELHMEAEFAVDLIKEQAEGRPHYIPMEERKMWADLIHG